MTNCGTEVHYAPANTPQYKAIGERWFHSVTRHHSKPTRSPYTQRP